MGWFSWLRQPPPDVEKEDKEVEREVFSEEFEWLPYEVQMRYDPYDCRTYAHHIPITLTGRWRVDKKIDGTSNLFIEVVTSVEKVRDYLHNYGNHEQTTWLASSKIELKAKTITTINECGE